MDKANTIRAEGYNGQVEFDGKTVVITRQGLRGKLSHGSEARYLDVAEIIRVDFKDPSFPVNEHIRFAVPGLVDKQAIRDRHCVIFLKKHLADFAAIRDSVNSVLALRGELSPERVLEIEEEIKLRAEAKAAAAAAEAETRAAATAAAEEEAKRLKQLHKPWNARYGFEYSLWAGLFSGVGIVEPIAGAQAVFEQGVQQQGTTVSRVAAGAIIAGPAGAVVGGMFKKDRPRVYVTVTFPNGRVAIVDGPASDEREMREFARKLNAASAYYLNNPLE